MHDWIAAREHAHGLMLRPELLAQGHDDRTLHRDVRRGRLDRVRTGAYLPGGTLAALSPLDRHRVLGRAVLLRARSDAVLSHGSALAELDVPIWGVDLDLVHVTRHDQRSGRRHVDVIQHRGELGEGDVVHRHGLDVTSGTRTALDLCCLVPQEAAVVAAGGLLHAGLTTPEQLRTRYDELRHRPGALGTEVVLRLVDARPESVGERRTAYRLWRLGLPTPVPQFEVLDRGRLVARLDFAWPERGVWLEFDGRVKYESLLREGESPADALLREKAREDLVRALTGWLCVRVVWADLEHPDRLDRAVRRAFDLAAAASRRTPASA